MGLICGTSASGWYDDPHWKYRQKITIHSNQVSGMLTNFPVLITDTNLQSGLWTHAQPDGDDILFTKDDGKTKLSHEIEEYTNTTQKMSMWLNMPVLSNTTDTVIYMYYGNPTAPNQENVSDVWRNGYVGVWHLKEDAAGANNADVYKDATTNAYHGDDWVSATGKVGWINGGQEFDGADDYVQVASFPQKNKELTVSFWMNMRTYYSSVRVLFIPGSWEINLESWKYRLRLNNGTSSAFHEFSTRDPGNDTGSWIHVAVTVNESNGFVRGYFDGFNEKNTELTVSNLLTAGSETLQIGKRYSNYFDGTLDEVRISDTTRSGAWIETSHNNQDAPGTFLTFGGEEEQPPQGTVIRVK